jgi:hypothetical protein
LRNQLGDSPLPLPMDAEAKKVAQQIVACGYAIEYSISLRLKAGSVS